MARRRLKGAEEILVRGFDDIGGAGEASGSPGGVIARLFREGTIVAASDSSVHQIFPLSVTPVEGEALRSWVSIERATRTIEIGLGYGVSTLFMCQALLESGDPKARHVVIDPFQATRFASCGLQVVEEAGLRDLVEFHAEESQIVLPKLVDAGRSFDLAFVDGNHRFDGVFLDLIYLGRLVRPGAVVFVDDYQLASVARATSFCVTNLNWTMEELSPVDDTHQWAVLRTSRSPDLRPYDHFADF